MFIKIEMMLLVNGNAGAAFGSENDGEDKDNVDKYDICWYFVCVESPITCDRGGR